MPNTFFTADLHLGHANIIKPEYCNRPFKDVQEMDSTLKKNWNHKIKKNDSVYILGDVAFCHTEQAISHLNDLNGNKYLVVGNHDRKHLKDARFRSCFGWIKDLAEIKIDGQGIVLCHYAMRVWNKSHYGYWQLYGHSHNSLWDDPYSLSIDVGVDCHQYGPISFQEVKEIMSKKTPKSIDHHKMNL